MGQTTLNYYCFYVLGHYRSNMQGNVQGTKTYGCLKFGRDTRQSLPIFLPHQILIPRVSVCELMVLYHLPSSANCNNVLNVRVVRALRICTW